MNIQFAANFPPTLQALIIPVVQNDGLGKNLDAIAKMSGVGADLLGQDFKAEYKELLPIYAAKEGVRRLYLLGLGKEPTLARVQLAFRSLTHRLRDKLPAHVGLRFPKSEQGEQLGLLIEAAVNGILLGRYEAGRYKTDEPKDLPFLGESAALDIITAGDYATAVDRAVATADTQRRILDLVNAPANKKTPLVLAEWAIASGETYDYQVEVYDQEQIEELGLHALLAVSRGSEVPPAFIVMEYQPRDAPTAPLRTIGLVGKGVTFDTGGISIKDSANMHMMKSDMGGAAAVLGAVELAARLQLPVHLVGVIPATENGVDARATKPGDVIGSYSGKSIEVIDTDAEGRLILADALAYLTQQFQVDTLIDLATLTGSVIGTLGYHAAGLFANDDALATALAEAGERTGERLWRLPLWSDYEEDLHSDVADLKNYHGKPVAGAIMGAKFLEVFTNQHPRWAHLDIAGVAFADSEFTKMRSATAFGIRLLTDFIETEAARPV